jgi:hypothetical protein
MDRPGRRGLACTGASDTAVVARAHNHLRLDFIDLGRSGAGHLARIRRATDREGGSHASRRSALGIDHRLGARTSLALSATCVFLGEKSEYHGF